MIYIDIETIPDQREGARFRAMADAKPPANYKNPDAIKKWREEHAEKAWLNTALDGTHGEIVAIGYKIHEARKPVAVLTRGNATHGERDLIAAFLSVCEDRMMHHQLPPWVGHCVNFDLRFLWQRKTIHGIPSAVRIPCHAKPWHPDIIDTAYEWTGKEHGIKLKTLHKAVMGRPPCSPDDLDIDGSQVWERWSAGDTDSIIEHCKRDVERVVEIHQRMGAPS